MRFAPAHPPERRAAVEALLRDTDLTMVEIGARTGISPKTVSTWSARSGQRAPRHPPRPGPVSWPIPRREALARLRRVAGVDPGDLAEVAGVARSAADAFLRACGLDGRPGAGSPQDRRDADRLDAAALRMSLRAHIARQIAAFDAALRGEGAAVLDSARVLRDLGGLKRLFDELVAEDPAVGSEDGGEPDLPALRAEIARRYARFVGEGHAP
jgi:hypothetical protein